jgi:hypothetical protein
MAETSCAKTGDESTAVITQQQDGMELDEITSYITKRFLTCTKACWRHFEFDIVQIKPPVMQLQLHLEQEQNVVFKTTKEDVEEALAKNRDTMLTGYFFANQSHIQQAESLLYEDMPSKFVWTKQGKDKCWALRDESRPHQRVIGRMPLIDPNAGDLFYLRILLKNLIGKQSFKDIRTVDNVTYLSNREACLKLGLLHNDSHWEDCLNDAVDVKMPYAIRDLFCTIIYSGDVADPIKLFNRFKDDMKEDFDRRRRKRTYGDRDCDLDMESLSTNDLLIALNDYFKQFNRSNAFYNLPMPDETLTLFDRKGELDPHAAIYVHKNKPLLNKEQRYIFNLITNKIDSNEGGCYKLKAAAGCGKTMLLNTILSYARMDNNIGIATAATGMGAQLLILGTTCHKRFIIPIPCHRLSSCGINLDSDKASIIHQSRIIVIDEAFMMHRNEFDCIDSFLQSLMQNVSPMGNKLVLAVYDPMQLPPVVPGGNRNAITSQTIMKSNVWRHFIPLTLTQNMRIKRLLQSNSTPDRIQELKDHEKWLLQVGRGTLPTVQIKGASNLIEVPPNMVCYSPKILKEKVYFDFKHHYNNSQYLCSRAILTNTNEMVQELNAEMLEHIPGETVYSMSIDECTDDKDSGQIDVDMLNKTNVSGLPPHELPLKVGASIILIRSLNPNKGFCNGTRCIIRQIKNNLLHASQLNASPNSPDILIPRIPMKSDQTKKNFVPFTRRQYPILLAYYLTFNRSQGQTLDSVGLFLPCSVHTHGQFYTGTSRCGDPQKIYIYANQQEFEHLQPQLDPNKNYTKNIVWPELFDDN